MNLKEEFYPWKHLIGQVILDVKEGQRVYIGEADAKLEKQKHHERGEQDQQHRHDVPVLQDGAACGRGRHDSTSGKAIGSSCPVFFFDRAWVTHRKKVGAASNSILVRCTGTPGCRRNTIASSSSSRKTSTSVRI